MGLLMEAVEMLQGQKVMIRIPRNGKSNSVASTIKHMVPEAIREMTNENITMTLTPKQYEYIMNTTGFHDEKINGKTSLMLGEEVCAMVEFSTSELEEWNDKTRNEAE